MYEEPQSNPTESLEHKLAVKINSQNMSEYYGESGFDSNSYFSSDIFYEREKLKADKIRK